MPKYRLQGSLLLEASKTKDNGRQEGTLSTSLRARLKVLQGQFLKLEASPENVGMKNSASPLAEPIVDCRKLEPGASIIPTTTLPQQRERWQQHWATCCSTSRPGAGHAPADYRLVRAEGRGMKDLIGSGLVLGAGGITRQLCQKAR